MVELLRPQTWPDPVPPRVPHATAIDVTDLARLRLASQFPASTAPASERVGVADAVPPIATTVVVFGPTRQLDEYPRPRLVPVAPSVRLDLDGVERMEFVDHGSDSEPQRQGRHRASPLPGV